MKIRKLFLKAFGPFTDSTLDFSGPANVHLIYGPNEAGKSSALRASSLKPCMAWILHTCARAARC